MNDLIGHPELTPHKGGWCGNDIFPGALSPDDAERARTLTRKLGDRLAEEGYRGFLEVDFLVDVDTGDLYLGEMNPRISGITSMTNVTAAAYADIPLFLFHMLEYLDVDYEIDVDEINDRWAQASSIDVWSQLVLKDTGDEVQQLTAAPRTGIWRFDGLRRARVRALGQRLAQPVRRVGGVLPARARARRLHLSRRRPRGPGRAHAHARRRQRADRPRARVDRRDPRGSSRASRWSRRSCAAGGRAGVQVELMAEALPWGTTAGRSSR